MPLQDLPDELLLKIFGFLSTHDILQNIALVCRNFYRLSQDCCLIKELYLGPKINDNCDKYASGKKT